MNKNIWIMTLVVFIASVSLVSAEEMKEGMKDSMMGDSKGPMMGEGRMDKGMMDKDMMGKGMRDGKMMGMHPMMKSMMEKLMVPTADGGVVVLMGNKLTKYDKDLNVVKEVEIKMDMEGMQKMMENMKSMCPMMGKGMMGGMDKQPDKAQDTAPAASDEVDHASHH